jgi:hydroxymethylbilane synthase
LVRLFLLLTECQPVRLAQGRPTKQRLEIFMRIVIGSRGSKLALWQAEHVAALLRDDNSGREVSIEIIKTSGDKFTDRPLADAGGKGLFVKEIEEALLAGKVDLAVHSLKDLPSVIPAELGLAAVLEREDPRDALISSVGLLAEVPEGAKFGTCSPRRAAQLAQLRPDLSIVPLRGNLDTRLRKVEAGEVDATLLAAAGLKRLGWLERATEVLPFDVMLPASGQGIIGLETRNADQTTRTAVESLNHQPSMSAALAERALVREVGADCHSPVAAYAVVDNAGIELNVMVSSLDGTKVLRGKKSGVEGQAEEIGKSLAAQLLADGAAEVLKNAGG